MDTSDNDSSETEASQFGDDENSQEDSWSTVSSGEDQTLPKKNFLYPLIYHAALEIAFDEERLLQKLIHAAFPSEIRIDVAMHGTSQYQSRPAIIYNSFDKTVNAPRMERIRTKARMVLDDLRLFDVDVIVERCEIGWTGGFIREREYDVWADHNKEWPLALPKVGANISSGPTSGYGTLSGYISITGKWAGRYALTCFHCCYERKSEVWYDYWSGYGPEDVARDDGNGVDLVPFWRREEEKLRQAEEKMKQRAREDEDCLDLMQFWDLVEVSEKGDENGQHESQIHRSKKSMEDRPLDIEREPIPWSKNLTDMYNLEQGEITYPSRPAADEAGACFMPGKLGRVVMGSGSISVDDFEMDWALLKLDEQRMDPDMSKALNITKKLQLTEEQVKAFDEGLPEEEWLENTMPKDFMSDAPAIKGFRTMQQLKEAYYRKDESRLRVLKYGATTGWTVGRLSTFPSAYNDSRHNIVHGLSALNLIEDEDFCIPGDSVSNDLTSILRAMSNIAFREASFLTVTVKPSEFSAGTVSSPSFT